MNYHLSRLTGKGMSLGGKQNLFFPLSLEENEQTFAANINREKEARRKYA